MSVASTVETITFTVAGVAWLAGSYWVTFRPIIKERRLVGGKGDDALQKVADGLDILHMLFGKQVSVTTTLTPEGRIIDVACRACRQRNRLKRGFRNAVCGSCSRPLTVLKDETKEKTVA